MKKGIKNAWTRFFSKLNNYWKWVRNICATLSVVLGSVVGSEYFGMIETDELLYKIVKYGLFATSIIALCAQNTKK
jgi:hypothetical protein